MRPAFLPNGRPRRARALPSLLLAALAVGAPGAPALAADRPSPSATTKVAVDPFEPLYNLRHNTLNVHGSEVLPHLRGGASLFTHYAQNLLLLSRIEDEERTVTEFVHGQAKLEVSAAMGLFGFLELGLQLPVVVYQSGDDLAFFGRPGEQVEGAALGDLRIVPKIQLLSPDKAAGFGLAVTGTVYVPVGDAETFNSDDEVRARPELVLDWRHRSGFKIAANLGYLIRPTRQIHNVVSDDSFKWGVGLEVPTGLEDIQLLATAFGTVQLDDDRDPADPGLLKEVREGRASPSEIDVAARFIPATDVAIVLGGGFGLGNAIGSPDWRAFLAVGYAPSGGDRDGDGIPDSSDQCPDDPEDKDGWQDSDGCPDPDNDGDGIPDVNDQCPNDPEDNDGFEDADGCPDPDNDKDGVPDVEDKCPDQPEDIDAFQDNDGCPDLDNDGDGIPDAQDLCPNQPEDYDCYEDSNGCPDEDNDQDGIPDVQDLCPVQPETVNGVDDDDGCPEYKDVVVRADKIEIMQKVFFDTAKATIQKRSWPLLDEVARVLRDNPNIRRVQIEGHTDDRGSDTYNMALSNDRAKSVREFLVSRGVEGDRLVAKGFGESTPIADNKTESGRAANRRVEFNVLDAVRADPTFRPTGPVDPCGRKKADEGGDGGDAE